MTDYKKMYAIMVGAADEAATLLEIYAQSPLIGRAYRILTDAMPECEEIYIDTAEEGEKE